MTNVFEQDLEQRADSLAADIQQQSVDQTWVIGGRWGTGKSSLLRALKPRLVQSGLMPVFISPPPRDMDTGPAALLQIAAGLRESGLINEDIADLEDPAIPWRKKLKAVVDRVKDYTSDIVLLCEEPGKWAVPQTADDSFSAYSNQHIHDVTDAIGHTLRCRRVFTYPAVAGVEPVYRPYDLPRYTQPTGFLNDPEIWGRLASVASELHNRLGANLAVATPLEIRMLIALAAVTSPTNVASFYSSWPDTQSIARRLTLSLSSDDRFVRLRVLWAKLALSRKLISDRLLDHLGAGSLHQGERDVLVDGLLHRRNEGYELNHALRFQQTVSEWLSSDERRTVHRDIAVYYANVLHDKKNTEATLNASIEGYHHASHMPVPGTIELFQAFFVDQLNKLGRTLSQDYRDFAKAADVFRQGTKLDKANDYAHHYLAYNIDSTASDPEAAEREYRKAIEINPEHPWWWSRWINFLITVGRSREAREQWALATDALKLTGGEEPAIVYQSLHLHVARLLAHRAQLDFAEAILNETPSSVRENDTRFRAIGDYIASMREAERARAVFPLTVSYRNRWCGPHLEFQRKTTDGALVKWFPAQVDNIDDENVQVIMAKPGPENQDEHAYVKIPRTTFDQASLDERSNQLQSGRFLELAFYGASEVLKIRVYPEVPWNDPDLPPLDPDPRRYLRKAGVAP